MCWLKWCSKLKYQHHRAGYWNVTRTTPSTVMLEYTQSTDKYIIYYLDPIYLVYSTYTCGIHDARAIWWRLRWSMAIFDLSNGIGWYRVIDGREENASLVVEIWSCQTGTLLHTPSETVVEILGNILIHLYIGTLFISIFIIPPNPP